MFQGKSDALNITVDVDAGSGSSGSITPGGGASSVADSSSLMGASGVD
jgi:hypothetical protein